MTFVTPAIPLKGGGKSCPTDNTCPFVTDRTEASTWETFTLVHVDAPKYKVALKTATGNYVTAVFGGGVGDPPDPIINTTDTSGGASDFNVWAYIPK